MGVVLVAGGGMNSPQVVLGQKRRVSQGVEYWRTALRKRSCLSRGRTSLMMAEGMGCVQQRGGILDSSVMDCSTMMARQSRQ